MKCKLWGMLHHKHVLNGDDIATCQNTGSIPVETFVFKVFALEKYHTILINDASSI